MIQEASPKSHVNTLGALGGYKPQIEGGPWEHAFHYTLYYVRLKRSGASKQVNEHMNMWIAQCKGIKDFAT